MRLVDAIARQTAIAIENAKLFEEAHTHAQAAKASEQKYRLLAEHVRDVIYALDAEGQFTYVNARVTEILATRRKSCWVTRIRTSLRRRASAKSWRSLLRQPQAMTRSASVSLIW